MSSSILVDVHPLSNAQGISERLLMKLTQSGGAKKVEQGCLEHNKDPAESVSAPARLYREIVSHINGAV